MMALIRRFEERTEEQYTRARIGGYCHLAIGEEASTVGAIDALQDGDCLFASYRDHGTALAVGSPPAAVMAELFGKETGVAHGRGGSMHLLDVQRRFFGGWGIVGAHLPIAAGSRAGARLHATSRTPCSASSATARSRPAPSTRRSTWPRVWDLPIVFQVINNQYGMGTSVEQSSAEPELWRRAAAYRMHGERVDGNDVLAVREAAGRLLEEARERAPAGADGDRHLPLSRPLRRRRRQGVPHPRGDHGLAQADPITRLRAAGTEPGCCPRSEIEEIWSDVAAEVKDAIDEALGAAFPDPDTLYEHVYGDPRWREQFAAHARRGAVRRARRGAHHGRPDLPRGAAPRARRGARPRRATCS